MLIHKNQREDFRGNWSQNSVKTPLETVLVSQFGFTKYAFAHPVKQVCKTNFLFQMNN